MRGAKVAQQHRVVESAVKIFLHPVAAAVGLLHRQNGFTAGLKQIPDSRNRCILQTCAG